MSARDHRRSRADAHTRRGVALVAVLWIVAALSILVTGMVQSQRDEIRLVATARQTLQAGAAGSAAVQLVLQQMSAVEDPGNRMRVVEVEYADMVIPVQVIPLNGLVDLNKAPAPLLTGLFSVVGGLPSGPAEALANALVASRVPVAGGSTGPRFEATEDLLQLPGVGFDLYARLSSSVTTDSLGSGRVNPMAAPAPVLAVLSGGNVSRAASVANARDAGQVGVDTTFLTAQFTDNAGTRRFKLQARVPLADGRRLLSTRMVDMTRVPARRLPWRVFQADDRIEPVGTSD